jgi:hypothetical protein
MKITYNRHTYVHILLFVRQLNLKNVIDLVDRHLVHIDS